MSRPRLLLGAALAILALAFSASSLGTYVAHRLWLGCAAVIALAVIDVAGFVGLLAARRRLARESAALGAEPPGGTLFDERRVALAAVARSGARPDLDALAAATSARELGRAYVGKYLVAVTVLVGLVGTFAGLMETLHGVAPLLKDDGGGTLALVAAPLAGLDVTFGASVVGILVTLALSLLSGDLALAEEETLTRLEERTRHVLVPSLWPRESAPEERAVRELSALRAELASIVADGVARAAEAAGARVAEIAGAHVERLADAVRAALVEAVRDTATRVERGAIAAAAAVEEKLSPVLAAQAARLDDLRAAADEASRRLLETSGAAERAVVHASEEVARGAAAVSASHGRLLDEQSAIAREVATAQQRSAATIEAAIARATHEHGAIARDHATAQHEAAAKVESHLSALFERLAAATAEHAASLSASQSASARASVDAIARLVDEQAARITALSKEVAAAVRDSVGAEGLRLGQAAASLSTAAGALEAASRSLGEPIARLQPELSALASEVALLASRGTVEEQAATLEELSRLGEGVERLEALLRMARGEIA